MPGVGPFVVAPTPRAADQAESTADRVARDGQSLRTHRWGFRPKMIMRNSSGDIPPSHQGPRLGHGRGSSLYNHQVTHPSIDHVRALQQIARNTKGSVLNRSLLLALTLVTVDVLLVAKLQQPSALAILQYTPPVTLFTGVLVNLLAVLLVPGVVVLATMSALAAVKGDSPKAIGDAVGATLLYTAGSILLDREVLINPLLVAVISVTATSAALAVFAIGRARSWSIDSGFVSVMLATIAITVIVSMLGRDEVRVAVSRPYLPAERIEVGDNDGSHDRTEIGYILDASDDGHWTTILREQTREILLVRSDLIVSRVVCRPAGISSPTPWWTIVDTPDAASIPPCD